MKKYSIVSFLEGDDYTEIRSLQKEIASLTGSRASMDHWEPHITMGNGVWVDDEKRKKLILELKELVARQQTFTLNYGGFSGRTDRKGGAGETTTSYVLWIEVISSPELQKLVMNISGVTELYNCWYEMPKPYIPHVTLAFRDLSEEGYQKGVEFLETVNLSKSFEVNNLSLVEKKESSDDEFERIAF